LTTVEAERGDLRR
jgi:hypothetical protein